MILRPLSAALLAAAIATPAAAGIFDEDARREVRELRAEIERKDRDLDNRLVKLEESIKNLGIIQLLNQIEMLNAEIAKLRGQNEVLGNQNEMLVKRQRDFYLDIDTRLRKLEGLPADAAPAPAPANGGPPAGPSAGAAPAPAPALTPAQAAAQRDQEHRAYDLGSNAFKRNDFAGAIRAFQIFIKDYPQSSLVANAHYWTGLSQYNLRDYGAARSTQEGLLKQFPDSPKAPDALLAIASVQMAAGDAGSEKNTLEDIIARFPASDAATKARTRLAQLRR